MKKEIQHIHGSQIQPAKPPFNRTTHTHTTSICLSPLEKHQHICPVVLDGFALKFSSRPERHRFVSAIVPDSPLIPQWDQTKHQHISMSANGSHIRLLWDGPSFCGTPQKGLSLQKPPPAATTRGTDLRLWLHQQLERRGLRTSSAAAGLGPCEGAPLAPPPPPAVLGGPLSFFWDRTHVVRCFLWVKICLSFFFCVCVWVKFGEISARPKARRRGNRMAGNQQAIWTRINGCFLKRRKPFALHTNQQRAHFGKLATALVAAA